MSYKSVEQSIRQVMIDDARRKVASQPQKPVEYQNEMQLEATDENLAYIQRVAADARKHHRRCEIQLKIIDNA